MCAIRLKYLRGIPQNLIFVHVSHVRLWKRPAGGRNILPDIFFFCFYCFWSAYPVRVWLWNGWSDLCTREFHSSLCHKEAYLFLSGSVCLLQQLSFVKFYCVRNFPTMPLRKIDRCVDEFAFKAYMFGVVPSDGKIAFFLGLWTTDEGDRLDRYMQVGKKRKTFSSPSSISVSRN